MQKFNCLRCEKEFDSYDSLRRHVGRIHKIGSEEFYIEFYWKGIIPKCSCGCNEDLNRIHLRGLLPDVEYEAYLKGHVARVRNNWGHNKKALDRSKETQRKMYKSGELKVWNKGLTKKDHPSLKQLSDVMTGREITWTDKISKSSLLFHKNNPGFNREQMKKVLQNPEMKKKFSDLGYRAQKHKAKFKFNKQEQKFYKEFLLPIFGEENIEQQKLINGHVVDFYIPSNNTIIEYYGDYWHGNPEKYEDDFLIEQLGITAKEKREQDKKRLEEINWFADAVHICIIWENDVKHLPVKVRKKLEMIKDALKIYKLDREIKNEN